jgi:uncharacterized protein YegP (UPF0339 family)
LYRREDGKWAWRLTSNGQVIVTHGGQGYENEQDARSMAFLVKMTVRLGTTDSLARIGVRSGSNVVRDAHPNMPKVGTVDNWKNAHAYFKGEDGTINIGLGTGQAGNLFERFPQHTDVVGGGVRAGVPGPQLDHQQFRGALGPVVDERAQRMEPVPLLERRLGVLLVRMRGHQGGVYIDDQRIRYVPAVIRGVGTGQRPRLPTRLGPGIVDCPQRRWSVLGEPGDQPGDRRIRSDAAASGRLVDCPPGAERWSRGADRPL